MSDKPIGVFDSGLGGLTAVKELLTVLPNENIIYFGDTGRVPYGSRSNKTIQKYALQDAAFLLSKDVKMIIAACGTVSSVVSDLNERVNVPYTGVLAPTARAAVNATRNGKIGVIGTTATIKSRSYEKEIKKINDRIEVFQKDCPLFVPLVENGFVSRKDPVTELVAQRYLTELRETGIDTLILGCTHYPILREFISDVMGDGVKLIDSGYETALYAADILKNMHLLNTDNSERYCKYYVSDSEKSFCSVAGIFLGSKIESKVKKIDIEEYSGDMLPQP